MLRAIDKYWQTLRHLRGVQCYGRVWFRLSRPKLDVSPSPEVRPSRAAWTECARRDPSMTGPGEFLFLSERGNLAELGWDGSQRTKLWRYNQHYFDDLNALGAHERRSWHLVLVENWMERNPPAAGTGWEPYPTSLRIVNWIKWTLAGNVLSSKAQHSLAIQTRWLSRRLETHLLGNHLLANAKTLLFAGVFFTGSEAEGWLRLGEALINRELDEQILPDGGHFERSPMYHLIILEDLLDLVNLYRCFDLSAPEAWRKKVAAMLHWAHVMRHPDGEIAFFNDAAFGIAPKPVEIDAYAARLGWREVGDSTRSPFVWLQASGYGRMSVGRAELLVDMAPLGPDYLPAHGHADSLSFELSLGSDRLIVNGGTSTYGVGPERQRQRSTLTHSTVVVDDVDSSEVWGGFRVARRARVTEASIWTEGETVRAAGAHDGYRRLPGRPTHRRTWILASGALEISDDLDGTGSHRIDVVFPLAPGFLPQLRPDGGIDIDREGEIVARMYFDPAAGDEILIEPVSWHPRFGQDVPAWRIRRRAMGAIPLQRKVRIEWAAL